MSSIMRRRNGLMTWSVMGMLLSRERLSNSSISRQDAPPRNHPCSAASPSALPRERFSPMTRSGHALLTASPEPRPKYWSSAKIEADRNPPRSSPYLCLSGSPMNSNGSTRVKLERFASRPSGRIRLVVRVFACERSEPARCNAAFEFVLVWLDDLGPRIERRRPLPLWRSTGNRITH